MQTLQLEEKINDFLVRKSVQYPSLALAGRHESRTVKYAETRSQFMPKRFFSRNSL